jgi:lipoprotein NlpI
MRSLFMVWSLAASVLVGLSATAAKADTVEELLKKAAQAQAGGMPIEALAFADQAIARDPKNAGAYLVRAGLHESQDHYAEAAADYTRVLALEPQAAEVYNRRGSAYFKCGQIDKSLEDFDRFLELRPREKAGHWRRGISLYYAGRFEEGQKQFEGYETVDTNDVENAVWRYLCMARRVGPAKAREAMLKIGKDTRVPMMAVYALFSGRAQPADVLAAARAGSPNPAQLRRQLFYAHLYMGLYYDSVGNTKQALKDLTRAAELRIDHYMWHVARVHRAILAKKKGTRGAARPPLTREASCQFVHPERLITPFQTRGEALRPVTGFPE